MTKGRIRLLLIAQDPVLTADLSSYLEAWNFEVTSHPDFASAVISLSLTEYEMAIIDADLPQTDCVALAGNLKSADINFPMIFYAGPISIEAVFDVLKHPRVLVLSKPFSEVTFAQAMERIASMPISAEQMLRNAVRIQVETPLKIEEYGPATATNLSLSGMFIETEADILQGTEITIVLQLPKHPELKIQARVARSVPGKGIGVAYIEVDQETHSAMRTLMFRALSYKLSSEGEITSN